MGILDDAIREHLDLKRRHGARDAELREIEDEAFGSAEQPDPFVAGEPYTEVGVAEPTDAGNEDPTRLVEPEALRPTEPPPEPDAPRPPEPETSDESIMSEPPSPIPGQVELPGQDEIPGQEQLDAEPDASPSTDEPESYRPAEADSMEMPEPPATSESLEELIAEEEPFPEDSAAPPLDVAPSEPAPPVTEQEPPSRPLEPEPGAEAPPEPESSAPDPPPPPPESGSEPPGRARGRVDVPTQEHPPPGDTGDLPPLPGSEPELGRPDTSYEPPPMEEPPSDEEPLPEETSSGADGPQLYDFETDEDPVVPPAGRSAVEDDFEALGPAEEEAPYLDEEEEPASGAESGREGRSEEPGTAVRPAVADEQAYDEGGSFDPEERSEEEEGEEDLWFEKGPPKDFDFDD